MCECGGLYEAVIASILEPLKQSDNPSVVNPRIAAQAVTNNPHPQQHARTLTFTQRQMLEQNDEMYWDAI